MLFSKGDKRRIRLPYSLFESLYILLLARGIGVDLIYNVYVHSLLVIVIGDPTIRGLTSLVTAFVVAYVKDVKLVFGIIHHTSRALRVGEGA